MGYKDIREYIKVLEAKGKLYRVTTPVDKSWEISCMAKWVYQGFSEDERFALLFEDVKDSSIPVATGLIGASREVYALALGTTPDGIHDTWLRALSNPIAPKVVPSGPVHDVMIPKDQIDLNTLPVPIWTPTKDRKPCITNCVISMDGNSGIQNIATYRCQIQSKKKITVNTAPGRQAYQNFQTYASKGAPAPVALAIGCDPSVHLAATAAVPRDVDEMGIAGALKGEPVEVVKGKTVDLLIPAHAEIVVEGFIHPTERMMEDSFGEFAGYMGPQAEKVFFEVTAITHRRTPLYYGYSSQYPPSEGTMLQGNANECIIHWNLLNRFGEKTVTDVAINQTHGGQMGHAIVQMTPLYPGHAKKVGSLTAEILHVKTITVVDDSIDIRHHQHLDMVLNSLVNPSQDVEIIKNPSPRGIDPSRDSEGMMGRMIIDATHKSGNTYPDVSLPPKDLLWKAYESWQAAGLPAFRIPDRVERTLDWHEKRMERSVDGRFMGMGPRPTS